MAQRKVEKGPWRGAEEQARARKPFFISRETVARDFPYTLDPYRSPGSEGASRSIHYFACECAPSASVNAVHKAGFPRQCRNPQAHIFLLHTPRDCREK